MRFQETYQYFRAATPLVGLVLALALATPSHAQNPTRDPETLERLSIEWMNAVERKDRVTLERILASDFQLVSIGDGNVPVKRSDWIENALRMDWQNRGYRNTRVDMHGDVAVVTSNYAFHVDPGEWKPAVSASSPVADVWVWQQGRWQVQRRYLGGSTIDRWLDRMTGFLVAIALAGILAILRRVLRRRQRGRRPSSSALRPTPTSAA